MGSEHSQTAHILGMPYILTGITTVRSALAWIIKVVWSLKSCISASRWIYGDWVIAATWLAVVVGVTGVTGVWAYTHYTLITLLAAGLMSPWFSLLVFSRNSPSLCLLWVCFSPGGRQDALILVLSTGHPLARCNPAEHRGRPAGDAEACCH